MKNPKLYMLLLGCTPKGRLVEQHDIFFGIAENLLDLVPSMNAFWPEAKGKLHIDAWREVTAVGGFEVNVVSSTEEFVNEQHLFFINLGGYVKDVFDEAHFKMLLAAATKAGAIKQAKETTFYKNVGFSGATSHIDDKYGVDIDDIFEINDVLSQEVKSKFKLKLTKNLSIKQDQMHLGYIPLKNLT
ncbi:hypothetical protein ABIB40_000946 [Pedobacter sp. UYP30]|uniref:DUF1543 domain-containing protein n=1 Tax=Pedobacter sp. UYP30 TaxID=1756400 RepID=UPI00339A9987